MTKRKFNVVIEKDGDYYIASVSFPSRLSHPSQRFRYAHDRRLYSAEAGGEGLDMMSDLNDDEEIVVKLEGDEK